MAAQPLTGLSSDADKLHPSLESPSLSNPDSRQSPWSLRRLLSGRGSRRYRVLEREPNRLRKRVRENEEG
ncbi:hypothetical protein N7468_001297 [Penicillium chermesinum]|uniref:Uncharacterized protein n=1 Tax=Penicillium chermesinum TaxID=63820 RepID=A0A9W9PGJ8_9EURO|nr:uncharacterized protein N7468_001297 [Penicillium chermesinum]KAJ5246314.1 hypothetical protein N7468_001297 [Penicillium chermesinum]KAJ6144601.1 hypothetical protein N7470_008496 [Penicillium chermesinum]